MEDIGDNHTVRAVCSNGVILEEKTHCSLSADNAKNLLGKTLDLDVAHKQTPVSDASRWASVIQNWHTESKEDQPPVAEALPLVPLLQFMPVAGLRGRKEPRVQDALAGSGAYTLTTFRR